MTSQRFLAFAGEPEALRTLLSSLVPEREAPPRLNRVLDCPDLVIFASPRTPNLAFVEDRGLLIGRLYRGGSSGERIRALSESECRHAAWSGGKTLLTGSWGSHAAFLRDEGAVTVLRDPSGAVPVYHFEIDGVRVFVSHAGLARDFGLGARALDEEFLRQWLTYPFLRTSRTGVRGVAELLPGTSCTWRDGKLTVTTLWTPWPSAAPERQMFDFDEAARGLRAALLAAVAAQLRDIRSPLLELSGGLDSSIVAACLAAADLPFRAVNFVTSMPDGDERDYARIMAAAVGAQLEEVHEDERPLELDPLPDRAFRPALSPVLQPLNRAFCAHARASRAGSFVTGAGGDNLFCYLTTAAPIIDAARALGPIKALPTLRDVAELGGCTIWTAASYALQKRLRLARRPIWKRDDSFLSAYAIAAAPDHHPWLDAPAGTPPGKLDHVVSLVRAQYFLEPEYSTGEAILHPLLSQPLMEYCLAVPTWLWLKGGRNRAVARAAFADLLPEEVLLRRTKGRLESMCARAYVANRTRLADLLLDGELARREFLDLDTLRAYLRADGPPQGEAYFRVFDLASLELWLRSGRF